MAETKTPFHNPFAALASLRGPVAPAGSTDSSALPVADQPDGHLEKSAKPIPRAVVRFERAGRGGKAVTVIEHLAVANRDEWLKTLKAALGCGGTVEDDRLVLQGDQRERLRTLLAAKGVKKITVA
jgi:translation initiation factor 1